MSSSPKKRITPQRALNQLEDLCARSEHCSGELREKLYRMGIGATDREAIIESLIARRFVDDERFARAYVGDRLTFARWGRRKIANSLAGKRVDAGIIATALAEINMDDYRAMIYDVMAAKMRSTGSIESRDDYMKLLRFGIQRGFEPELVVTAVRKLRLTSASESDET